MLIKGQCREAPPLACFYTASRSVAPDRRTYWGYRLGVMGESSRGIVLDKQGELCPCVLMSKRFPTEEQKDIILKALSSGVLR